MSGNCKCVNCGFVNTFHGSPAWAKTCDNCRNPIGLDKRPVKCPECGNDELEVTKETAHIEKWNRDNRTIESNLQDVESIREIKCNKCGKFYDDTWILPKKH